MKMLVAISGHSLDENHVKKKSLIIKNLNFSIEFFCSTFVLSHCCDWNLVSITNLVSLKYSYFFLQ